MESKLNWDWAGFPKLSFPDMSSLALMRYIFSYDEKLGKLGTELWPYGLLDFIFEAVVP